MFKTMSIADIHLTGGPETDEAEALLKAAQVAVFQGVEAVFVNGDVYHAKSTPIQRLIFKRFIDSLIPWNVKVVILRGNHDEEGDLAIFHDPDRGVYVHEQPGHIALPIAGPNVQFLEVHTIPHFNAAKVALEAESLGELGEKATGYFDMMIEGIFQNVRSTDTPSIVLAHGVVSDAHLDNGMIPKQDGIILNGDKLAMLGCPVRLGHYHAAQEPRPNVRYSGSIVLRNYGETGDKGVLIDTFENGQHVACEFVSLEPAPRMTVDAEWDGEGWIYWTSVGPVDGLAMSDYKGAKVRFRYKVRQSQAVTVDVESIRKWFEEAGVRELKFERDLIIETAVRSESIQQATTVLDMHEHWLGLKKLEAHIPIQRELYNRIVKGIEPEPKSPNLELLEGEQSREVSIA